MKTFEQCCDEVAKKNYSTITESTKHKVYSVPLHHFLLKDWQEAAELYAREKVKEAVELARETERFTLQYTYSSKEEILEKLGLGIPSQS